jgi:hypothetical protein
MVQPGTLYVFSGFQLGVFDPLCGVGWGFELVGRAYLICPSIKLALLLLFAFCCSPARTTTCCLRSACVPLRTCARCDIVNQACFVGQITLRQRNTMTSNAARALRTRPPVKRRGFALALRSVTLFCWALSTRRDRMRRQIFTGSMLSRIEYYSPFRHTAAPAKFGPSA